MGLTLPTATRSAMADALNTLINDGSTIEIRTTPRSTTADVAATGTLLATVALQAAAFTEAGGVLTIADPAPVAAVAAGTAAWFRLLNAADGTVLDGSVTTTGLDGDLELATTALTVGLSIDITGGTITMPAGSAT